MRHWKSLVLWFLSDGNRGTPVPFWFFALPLLYLSENKEQVLSIQVFQKTILWITFFNSNLQFSVPATQRTYRRKSCFQSSCLPSGLLFLTTITGLWPLIHLKCSWVIRCCSDALSIQLLFLFLFFLPLSLAALPFPFPHSTVCLSLKVVHSTLSLPHSLVKSLISEH